jgi:hypothetical protein
MTETTCEPGWRFPIFTLPGALAWALPGALAGGLLLLLGACANVKPLEYTEIHEIQPSPGLLSGEDGEFVLFEY